MNRGRRRFALLGAAVLMIGLAGVPPASAHDVYAGSCVVQLRADIDHPAGMHMTVTTNVSSACVVNGGTGRVDLSGELVPEIPGIQFTCRENLGEGLASLRFYSDPAATVPDVEITDIDFHANDVDGAVEATTVKHAGRQHLVGAFAGVRSPLMPQACAQGTNPVVWAGVYTFEIVVD